jgi:hypothetical protein
MKKSDELLIPKVHNTNIDKSMGLIYKSIMRFLRKNYINGIKDNNANNGLPIYEEFNKVSHNVWSSSAVKEYIKKKFN